MQLDKPVECASGDNPSLLYKILHLPFFPLVRILCALHLESQKNYLCNIDAGPLEFHFLWPRGCLTSHSELCCFVSGSYAKHQAPSPVIILFKKLLFASTITIMPWQDVTRSSLCSGVKQCGTKRAHNFLFPKSSFRIQRTTVLGMFKDSAIILDAIQRSFLTKSTAAAAAAAMFTSVQIDFGRLPLSLSSISSLPSWNWEYHLKTFDWFRASFP